MAYHSNENDYADMEMRIEERRRGSTRIAENKDAIGQIQANWDKFKSRFLPALDRVAHARGVYSRPKDGDHRFSRDGVFLQFFAKPEGIFTGENPEEAITDLQSALELFNHIFPANQPQEQSGLVHSP